ncbi:serine/threonine protein kinase [Brachybacterium muris]|uniref:serine/threonine-protein kinase n=1 Tax=Brachybacterium muris TaxID=219301 RepID=UPI0021A89D90|nr:serine/threonine-protein kinase [Brachybacterium muris]MCT1431176.1 serine/threonine protein kinase [Brachybacterium muris]
MSSRPPSQPPQLPGYEFEKLLGSGGFADVFLYRQFRPQRRVAIKVLLSSVLDENVRRQFDAEANVMATMSTHPSIVTIHTADASSDHRPFIVMEYCPRPNYGVRFRKERITVAEALRVGVQIAGAVETAHRAGILHRDIKPANILVTEYNRPALTDFGISIVAGQSEDVEDSQGMSIPWSPPEFFADPVRADVRSDVFALAATVYSLLASHTPFERVGQRNTASDLIHRITTEPLRPLNRPDVPPELNRVLSIAMAKDPAGRYDTALAVGRSLQQVELALSLPVTQMDVLDDRGAPAAPLADEDELDSHTRIRKVSTVDPETGGRGTGSRRLDPFSGVAPPLGAPSSGGFGSPASASSASASPVESTMLRPAGAPVSALSAASPASAPPSTASAPDPAAERRTPAWPFVTLAAALVILLGVGATFAARTYLTPPEDKVSTSPINAPVTKGPVPNTPTDVTITVITAGGTGDDVGRAQVAWKMPEGFQEDYHYQVEWVDLPENYSQYRATFEVHGRDSRVLLIPPNLPEVCAHVRTVDPDGQVSPWSDPACLNPG